MRTRREERLLAEPENEHEDRFARKAIEKGADGLIQYADAVVPPQTP